MITIILEIDARHSFFDVIMKTMTAWTAYP